MDPTVEEDLLTGGGGFVREPRRIVAVPPGKPTTQRRTHQPPVSLMLTVKGTTTVQITLLAMKTHFKPISWS